MFQVFPGFATDFNEFTERRNLNAPMLPRALFTAYCVLTLCTVIPYLGLAFYAANYVLLLVMVSKVCNAVNGIPEGRRGGGRLSIEPDASRRSRGPQQRKPVFTPRRRLSRFPACFYSRTLRYNAAHTGGRDSRAPRSSR